MESTVPPGDEETVDWTQLPDVLWLHEIVPQLHPIDTAAWAATCRECWQLSKRGGIRFPPMVGVDDPWFRALVGPRQPPWVRGLGRAARRLPDGVIEMRLGAPLRDGFHCFVFLRPDETSSILFHGPIPHASRMHDRRMEPSALWMAPQYVDSIRLHLPTRSFVDRERTTDRRLRELDPVSCTLLANTAWHMAQFWFDRLQQVLLPPGRTLSVDTPYLQLETRKPGELSYGEISTGRAGCTPKWKMRWCDAEAQVHTWAFPNEDRHDDTDLWTQLTLRKLGFS